MSTFWLIFEKFCETVNSKKLINKYIPTRSKYLYFALILLSISFFVLFFISNLSWYLLCYMISLLTFTNLVSTEIKKIKTQKYGSDTQYFRHKVAILVMILREYKVYSSDQVKILIDTLKEYIKEGTNSKNSSAFIDIVSKVMTSLVIPIAGILIKEYGKQWFVQTETMWNVILIVFLLLILFGAIMIIKPLIEDIRDRRLANMKEMKSLLTEIYLTEKEYKQ
ncbi:hypothetical protein PM3016_6703 [Paenibacillus mucilaginosus 3016]|uniref:Uncharacterized protein n=1 Tax=Paenibacillus mucilaginosus 3016 TaxID=1116391 RepID=H6NNJ0_9BACL|nr:hypothetical protein [Paenibacillus mucilaginosus]AFC33311.1 hypothetical protein PM3016_6703 [Paenibacillus mucilaginosus 3016]WFA21729.1 hypothetical protein ERY13_33285 [Paenibacillus mucilaginosus]